MGADVRAQLPCLRQAPWRTKFLRSPSTSGSSSSLCLRSGGHLWSLVRYEKTLSIHSIFTRKREAFYWLTVLFTFALGTAVGDQISEGLSLGYWQALLIFAAAIAAVALAYYVLKVHAVLAFWTAYVLTRPLGASMGDLLSQPEADKGFGFGAGITSGIYLGLILLTVVYLTASKRDVIPVTTATTAAEPSADPAAVSPI
eukprot:15277-Heterococcus_DN1.PRE.4